MAYRKWGTVAQLEAAQEAAAQRELTLRGERQAALDDRWAQRTSRSAEAATAAVHLLWNSAPGFCCPVFSHFALITMGSPAGLLHPPLPLQITLQSPLFLPFCSLVAQGLEEYAATELCRDFVQRGAAPLAAVVEALAGAHRRKLAAQALTDRLEAEGLGEFRQEELCQRHLADPQALQLEAVIDAIRAHKRRAELWQR